MAKKPDGWIDEADPDKPNQHIGCGNLDNGCGKQFRIIGYDKKHEMVLAENFNPRVRLCVGCGNALAHKWWIEFEDLDFLMTAIQVGRAGMMGKPAPAEKVLELFKAMGGRRKQDPLPSYHHLAKLGAAVPVGDRE